MEEFVERKYACICLRTPLSSIHPREIKNYIHSYAYVYSRFTHNHQKEKRSKYSSPGNI